SGFPFVDLIQPDSFGSRESPRNGKSKSEPACRSLDREMSSRIEDEKFRGVYAFEDNAEETFRAAGRRGLLRIYDLPLGHWRAANAILEEETELDPDWAPIADRAHDVVRQQTRKDAELEQADLVFVASSFTLRTLEKMPELGGSVAMVPYGAPLVGDECFEW